MLPDVVADIFQARKESRQPSEEQQLQGNIEFQHFCLHLGFLRVNEDGLQTISLAAGTRNQEMELVVCPHAFQQKLIWETYKQAHTEAN